MMKHWKTQASRDDKSISLYVTTSDEKIAEDLACGPGYSLTLMGRQDNYRQNPTQDTDHIDFATGAFGGAAHHHKLRLGSPISEVDSIPDGLLAHHLGGKDRPYLIAVYEEEESDRN
jgi:hypothetical protein